MIDIRPATDAELELHGALREQGYGFTPPHGAQWAQTVRDAGLAERVLAAEIDGRLVGTTSVWPLAQYFGGRAVPMGGVGSVVVVPEWRGRGICSALLGAAIAEMGERGEAISTLGPATVGVYRRAGWELAIDQHWRRVPTAALRELTPSERRERPATESDAPALRALYERHAPRQAGSIVRPDWMWESRLATRPGRYCFVVDRDGGIGGYTTYSQSRRTRGGYDIIVDDLVADDWDTERVLWQHFAAHRAQADAVVVQGVPLDALGVHLPEQAVTTVHEHRWMLRIVDAAAAIAARGYPASVRAAVPLELDDAHVAQNSGRFVLRCEDGTQIKKKMNEMNDQFEKDQMKNNNTTNTDSNQKKDINHDYIDYEEIK